MAELMLEPPLIISAEVMTGTREGAREVGLILSGGPFRDPPGTYEAHGIPEAASVFLTQLLFMLNLANGKDPRNRELLTGESRGYELARQYVASPTLEVCCDYCGGLMVQAIANAVASMMKMMHGTDAATIWDALTTAIIPRQQAPGPITVPAEKDEQE
jgi:hypothetical protein